MATASTALPAERPVADAAPPPRWLEAVDDAVIGLINVMLALEVLLVFASTMERAIFNSSSMMWVDEVSPLFLVTLAFMGGAVAYGHGQFIAIKVVLDRLSARMQRFLNAATEWIAIVVSILFWIFLNLTRAGRGLYAVGGNPVAARYCGIDQSRQELLAYSISGAVAASDLTASVPFRRAG